MHTISEQLTTINKKTNTDSAAFFQDNLGKPVSQRWKPFWTLMKQEKMKWKWHQLDHMQIICTSLQTGNHASNSSLNF